MTERSANVEQRLPAGDQVAHGGVALGQAQLARVHAVGADGDERLGDEALVVVERPQRRLLPGRVAVEGEDDLAAEPSASISSRRSTAMWSPPNAVPQVATAVGTPARWQAITSV